MMNRKTKKMLAVEERFQQPLEKMLPELVTEWGLSATAEQLGVSKATLGYWLLKLGINVRRVALAPGETLEFTWIELLHAFELYSPHAGHFRDGLGGLHGAH